MITLEFSRSPGLVGQVIRTATWSEWDHVSFVAPGGTLLSALPGRGVTLAPRTAGAVWQRFEIGSPSAIYRRALGQIGKPYDWSAVIGIGLHRDWREEDSFFCSELVAWAFEVTGWPLLRADRLNRITPRDLAMSPLLIPADRHPSAPPLERP